MPAGRLHGAGLGRVIAVVCVAGVALTACGSATIRPYTGTTTATGTTTSAGTARASGLGFSTVIPSGFTDRTAASKGSAFNFQYLAVGAHGTNINVVREAAGPVTDLDTLAHLELRTIKRIFSTAHSFSPIDRLTVAGTPARGLDYLNGSHSHPLHQRQITALHGGHVYVITYTALPSFYTTQSASLTQVLAAWRWS